MLTSTTIPQNYSGSEVCPRCHGFLILDDMIDVGDAVGLHLCFGMRCINCGNVVDPLIVHHQRIHYGA